MFNKEQFHVVRIVEIGQKFHVFCFFTTFWTAVRSVIPYGMQQIIKNLI